ncbi:hypothetical protein [Indioceanicola profundi]|nr:hypothetical protein [Indioceanicola profundi]
MRYQRIVRSDDRISFTLLKIEKLRIKEVFARFFRKNPAKVADPIPG